ncbi:cytochrome P450 [Mycobacteroides franklinii]|uniref:Cytochrome P450 107B1 n=1 Tax=Mycobacteroides franklinii TaxID=948102 RepID=A0A4R8R532_9MYCO|nr:cytochrome P450 [Mycobacteroides franklinii]TDZ44127.1 Cytochrome P450 107B1 [Mycobacteroides franklinii]TDZ51261.1 Cytochrome P450 107B1 [Mycobacteroides franklinii]TDZ57681.1 Cytochrome P450 107B1 [Mycobacteroides franklinii]TDZ64623.1 Cytochrome P450 107B1 [Mycobacteroides franklinii]TDZ71020.1 Cytochrome P450 107B1 [Mycobacteroides franklinii]
MTLKHDMRLVRTTTSPVVRSIVTNASNELRAKVRRRVFPGVQETTFDPMDPQTAANPHVGYRALLAGGRVHYNRKRNIFILCRYEDVRAAARNDALLSNRDGVVRARFDVPVLLNMDRPRHTELRRKALPGFTRGALEGWAPTVDQLAAELVTDLLDNPGWDVVEHLAVPLPMRMIAHILGIPPEDEAFFRHWSNESVRVADVQFSLKGVGQVPGTLNGVRHLHDYFMTQLGKGNLLGSDTMLGKLVADAGEGQISHDELFYFALLLLLAGNETTTNLLSTMFLTMSENPDQFELVRSDPQLLAGAVEEQLRYSSPIQNFYRTAAQDYCVGDAVIPAGSRVALLWGAANRDPREFEDPDRFLAARPVSQHVAFGSGVHLCLGAGLARMEGQAVLRELVNRVERIEITDELRWTTNSSLRGLEELRVRAVPR